MRVGVIADVHGNLPALEACLAWIDGEGVDAWVCAGDLVGYGPFPNECIERVAALPGLVCVAGNHDLIALGRLSDERCIRLARDTLAWTTGVLSPTSRAWLEALPLRASTGTVEVAHGSLTDVQEYVRTPERAAEQLAALGPEREVLILGHTHEPLEHRVEDRLLVNPGSVGQSRDRTALARAAVLDVAARSVVLRGVEYDVERTRAALRSAGLPDDAHHLRPRPLRRAAGRLLRLVRAR